MPRRRSGDCLSIRLQGPQTRANSRIFGRKVSASRNLRNRKLRSMLSFLRQLPVWGLCVKELSLLAREWRYSPATGSTGFASKSFGHVACPSCQPSPALRLANRESDVAISANQEDQGTVITAAAAPGWISWADLGSGTHTARTLSASII